ncbi:heme exporter protein CcmD [Polycladidibacter stylochi]|uniref:heme exporter protein CcmD n=1 Tax=Polycladidibacter stylochi TaxID=1807766 RepID=UPI00082DE176|nr:heme exporter protein CcmD [Pseudovibrio stylochi]
MELLGFDLGRHAGYIIAAYSVSAFVILMLLWWIKADKKQLDNELEQLEKAGIKRRSANAPRR